jgi:dTDP-4-amino-4,6-dideoxygalactose transaminase
MENLAAFLSTRRNIALCYDRLVSATPRLEKLPVHEQSQHAYYKYPVQVVADIEVAGLKKSFAPKYGFELESLYWPTCHLQPVYKKLFGYGPGAFPVAEATLSQQITLPIHAAMTIEEAEYAFECVMAEIEASK